MPWQDPSMYPVAPGEPQPAPVDRDYRWKVTCQVGLQQQSSYVTRNPGVYDGNDIQVGQWIANISTGQAWQIISVESKSASQVVVTVQDIYRYNTYRDPFKLGNGSPPFGTYIVFDISDEGLPQIDPVPDVGVSSVFTQNLTSRFEYINLQYDYPLYQAGNTFGINDVIAVDTTTNSFVLASEVNKLAVGRVTSISDTIPGWFTINPVQKVVDFLDYLPGEVGDIIYSSTTETDGVTSQPGGAPLYIKLRNHTQSISYNLLPGPTSPGNVFQLNGVDITVGGTGSAQDLISAVNQHTSATRVTAESELMNTRAETDPLQLSSTYGELVLFSASNPASVTINGVSVTFDILSSEPGYESYSRAVDMAAAINLAAIPNIVASSPNPQTLLIENTAGAAITIVNGSADINGVFFAGPGSASGISLSTPASTAYRIKFSSADSRAINFLDVLGTTIDDFGLVSVENGIKACGMYIGGGLRSAVSTVVTNLTQMNALTPLIGDTAYVIDSNDGQGNQAGEWSLWLFNGSTWVQTANQDSASTDAKSLEYTVTHTAPAEIAMGEISTGRRVTLITVEVTTPFEPTATLSIGYRVNNTTNPVTSADGLMTSAVIDLSVTGTYTTGTDILFGTDTPEGDVDIIAHFSGNGATTGAAQIIVSYV